MLSFLLTLPVPYVSVSVLWRNGTSAQLISIQEIGYCDFPKPDIRGGSPIVWKLKTETFKAELILLPETSIFAFMSFL